MISQLCKRTFAYVSTCEAFVCHRLAFCKAANTSFSAIRTGHVLLQCDVLDSCAECRLLELFTIEPMLTQWHSLGTAGHPKSWETIDPTREGTAGGTAGHGPRALGEPGLDAQARWEIKGFIMT